MLELAAASRLVAMRLILPLFDDKSKFEIDPSKNDMASRGINYAVAEPSFRVFLNCAQHKSSRIFKFTAK
jgi:hypothetical protein